MDIFLSTKEQQNEILERELDSSKSEIKINQNRLEAFQNAFNSMNNEDEDDEDDDEESDDDEEEDEDIELDLESETNHHGHASNELDDLDEDYGEDLENRFVLIH